MTGAAVKGRACDDPAKDVKTTLPSAADAASRERTARRERVRLNLPYTAEEGAERTPHWIEFWQRQHDRRARR